MRDAPLNPVPITAAGFSYSADFFVFAFGRDYTYGKGEHDKQNYPVKLYLRKTLPDDVKKV